MTLDKFLDWIPHDGDGCPLPVGTYCRHKHRNGKVCEHVVTEAEKQAIITFFIFELQNSWFWSPDDMGGMDIVEYQILGTSEEEHYTHKEDVPESVPA